MSEEEEGHHDHHHQDAAEYAEPVEGEENPFYQRKKSTLPIRRPIKKSTATAAGERDQLVPFQHPVQDPSTMSVGYQVTDAVAYYGNVGLWALFYGRGTRGIMTPVLYDNQRGGL